MFKFFLSAGVHNGQLDANFSLASHKAPMLCVQNYGAEEY